MHAMFQLPGADDCMNVTLAEIVAAFPANVQISLLVKHEDHTEHFPLIFPRRFSDPMNVLLYAAERRRCAHERAIARRERTQA